VLAKGKRWHNAHEESTPLRLSKTPKNAINQLLHICIVIVGRDPILSIILYVNSGVYV